jgi:hypothetical protein
MEYRDVPMSLYIWVNTEDDLFYSSVSVRMMLITVSYAPRKMAPPREIHVVRAMPPRKSVFTPSSLTIRRILEGIDKADPLDAGSVGLGFADCRGT